MNIRDILLPRKGKAVRVLATTTLAFFSLALVAQAASTIGANLSTTGTLAVTGLSTLTGGATVPYASTGNAVDITSSGIWTSELIDINVGAQAATGDVINIDLGATAVAAQALVVNSSGASSTDGWVLSGDNSGDAVWTGDMLNFRTGTADVTGDMIDLEIEAGALTAQALVVNNAAATTADTIDLNMTGATTGNTVDVTYSSGVSTGNAVDLNMGTNVAGDALNIASSASTTGDSIDITYANTRTSGAALKVTDQSVAATVTGDLVQIDVTGTPDVNILDVDVSGISTTSNALDVTYSAAATGNGVDLNMGSNVAGDAINIASAGTGGSSLVIDTTGIFTDHVIKFDNSGDTAWTGDIFNATTGTGNATGEMIDLTIEDSTDDDVTAIAVTSASQNDQAGWLMDIGTSAAWTGNAIDADIAGAIVSTGNFLDVTYSAGAHTGNAVDLNMGTDVAGDAINVASAATSGSSLVIDTTGVFTDHVIKFDNSGDTAWTGDIFNATTGTGNATGEMIDLTIEDSTDDDVTAIAVTSASQNDQAGWLMDIGTSAAWTGNAIDADIAGAIVSTGNFLDVTYSAGAHTGNAVDLNMGTDVAGNAIDISLANTSGKGLYILDSTGDTADNAAVWVENTDATVGAQSYLFRGRYTAAADTEGDFLLFEDNNGDDVFLVGESGELNNREETEAGAIDITATAPMSGRTFFLGTAGKDVTLPTPSAGLIYRFVVTANVATTNMLVQGPAADATDDVIYGSVVVAGAVLACSAKDTLTFVADTNEALPGDWIELRSDGTNWYINGDVATASAFTCTDAD